MLKNRALLWAIGGLGVIVIVMGGIVIAKHANRSSQSVVEPIGPASPEASSQPSSLSPCTTATATGCDKSKLSTSSGSNGSSACKGKGPATITSSPIALSDILYIQPMGLEIGGHVTPIDHGYFYIKGAQASPPTIAPVYAPLDGIVTSVTRTVRQGDPAAKADHKATATYDDDAVTIAATCTFRVRFSNMVKFDGALGKQIGQLKDNESQTPNLAVKAGDLIGFTGLPTAYGIDVWVENDDSTLTGFVNPKQYSDTESWKLHVVDFYNNTQEPLKSQLLAYAMRDVAPYFGKIDDDIDGKLVGSWFKVGTGGYGGGNFGQGGNYWVGHLSIVPDGNDPTQTDISFGDYQGQAKQFAVIGNKPDPATVDQSSGLIKYELGQIENYSGSTGQVWDNRSFVPHIKTRAKGPAQGVVLMQMTAPRSLKMEIFPGKTAAQVAGFDSSALMYER